MSRQKDSNPPKSRPADDDIHTTPPEGLKDALDSEGSDELEERGRKALEEAVKSRSVAPPSRSVRVPAAEKEEQEEDADAEEDSREETEDDLVAATGAFAEGVDTITSALLVLLGKYEESSERLATVSRILLLCVVIQILVFAVVGFMVYRMEGMMQRLERDRQSLNGMSVKLNDAAVQLADIVQSQKDTDVKIEEVKKETEKKPDIEIVADERGGAKVVITPKTDEDKKDKPLPPSYPPKGPKDAKPPAIEIPIPGAKTSQAPVPPKPPQGPSTAQQAPPPPPQ